LSLGFSGSNLARVSEVTHILDRAQSGDPKAAEELLPLVYEELRKLAAVRMAQEAPGQTLQPTALVHEAGCGWVINSALAQRPTSARRRRREAYPHRPLS
jgi:hypothetical protein